METIRITSQNCGTPRICRCEGEEPCGDCSVYDLSDGLAIALEDASKKSGAGPDVYLRAVARLIRENL